MENTKSKYICFGSIMGIIFLLCLGFASRGVDNEPESNIFTTEYHIDLMGQTTTTEDIIGKSELDKPQIQVKDNNVLIIERKGNGYPSICGLYSNFSERQQQKLQNSTHIL